MLEAMAIVIVGTALGLVANAISPVGLEILHAKQSAPPWWAEGVKKAEIDEGIALYESGAFFVDARPEDEYLRGHIAGAVSVDVERAETLIFERLDMLPRDTRVVTYCDDFACGSSMQLAQALHDYGFEDVTVFHPGWSVWTEQNLPTADGDADMQWLTIDAQSDPTAWPEDDNWPEDEAIHDTDTEAEGG